MSNYDMPEGTHRTFTEESEEEHSLEIENYNQTLCDYIQDKHSHETITEHLKKFNNDHFV
jgi:hypothetical protein